MRLALAAALLAALTLAGPAEAARFAVGVSDDASLKQVAEQLARDRSGPDRHSGRVACSRRRGADAATLRRVHGVSYVERLNIPRRLAFVPNDPLVSRQWHLENVRAFEFWPELPRSRVCVAVIDSGIDGTHPELEDRIAASRSFVGGSALTDQQGHGTFVAGLIAAQVNNGRGSHRDGVPGSARRREGRAAEPHRLAGGRGGGDPLGRRPGCA